MESLSLFNQNKERVFFLIFCFVIFSTNILFYYQKYLHFKDEEVFKTTAKVVNIYDKKRFYTLKLQSDDFISFISTSKDIIINKNDQITLYLLTEDISFIEYLKGFYTKGFNLTLLNKQNNISNNLQKLISTQHTDKDISSIYEALFLAIPMDKSLREIFAKYGISHLIAISGFHLAVLSFVLYFKFEKIYSFFHQRYLPFRNKRYDLLLVVCVCLFLYLILTGVVPSLLRAFVMFLFGIFLLRNNIKLLSFETLFITVVLIVTLFPRLIFSLSLWFSVAGVFYIYLFIKYFKNLNKYIQIILFNFWIYLSINPIVHYFFGTTAYEQLFSPILTILFTVFYPFTLLLHILGVGGLMDSFIQKALDIDINSFELFTPLWFFLYYLAVSFASIIRIEAFYLLNFSFVGFSFYLFL
ncbi:MAG: ComEC/Rec2 family competence protein [Campylobacterota bacterium]|nr:ComEC/Rec2 family competence protein [Campylobacterota bacterium]